MQKIKYKCCKIYFEVSIYRSDLTIISKQDQTCIKKDFEGRLWTALILLKKLRY